MKKAFSFFILIILMCPILTRCGGGDGGGGESTSTPSTVHPVQMGGAIQGNPLILLGAVSTMAGVAPGSADGTGAAARFHLPFGITTDGTSLYVTDGYNNTIRKIVIATGEVTTLGGTAGQPGSTDGTGAAARFS